MKIPRIVIQQDLTNWMEIFEKEGSNEKRRIINGWVSFSIENGVLGVTTKDYDKKAFILHSEHIVHIYCTAHYFRQIEKQVDES